MKVTIFKNDDQHQRTEEIHDQFVVPGLVVEIITSPTCEMTFILDDGTRIESTDIP